ncbi:hypothetical protein H2198_001588 [Neophaeococcomyces mojaviensis]|uniref:Uncharacterized protein n=1 Tax=Neophaeococcomyces mojaviensis TaxID=3383035 RepID=A0ACC3AGK3_9EURO|nr:hypothetical protein H2198_001588 [Knufia sp. JES_112]
MSGPEVPSYSSLQQQQEREPESQRYGAGATADGPVSASTPRPTHQERSEITKGQSAEQGTGQQAYDMPPSLEENMTDEAPPAYDNVIAGHSKRYFLNEHPVHNFGSNFGDDRTMTISFNETPVDNMEASDGREKQYHIIFKENGLHVHRGIDHTGPVVAYVTFQVKGGVTIEIVLETGRKLSMNIKDLYEAPNRETRRLSQAGTVKQRLPIKGSSQDLSWEIIHQSDASDSEQRATPKKLKAQAEENLRSSLNLVDADGNICATFTSTYLDNRDSKDKALKNEWGYLEVLKSSMFEKTEATDEMLAALVSVLEMNVRLCMGKRHKSAELLGVFLGGVATVMCTVM